MKRYIAAVGLGLWTLGLLSSGGARSQEQKGLPPLPPPVTPAPAPTVPPVEKKPRVDPTEADPRLRELLNPTQATAVKQVPIAIRGRVVTPTASNALLDFGGRVVMVRKGNLVTVQSGDSSVSYRVMDINESEVVLETPTKEILSIR